MVSLKRCLVSLIGPVFLLGNDMGRANGQAGSAVPASSVARALPSEAPPEPPAATMPLARPGILQHFHHAESVPACATCTAVSTTTRSTEFRYESRPKVVCYQRERCACLRCFFHFHGHHEDCTTRLVPVVKRELIRYTTTKETPGVKYEGTLTARPMAPVPAAATSSRCALHGMGCPGHP